MKKDLGDGAAVHGLCFRVLDVIDRSGQPALSIADDAVRHLLGRHALELPDDANDRNIYFRKNIDRRSQNNDRTQDEDQQGHNNEGVRPL